MNVDISYESKVGRREGSGLVLVRFTKVLKKLLDLKSEQIKTTLEGYGWEAKKTFPT